MTTATPIVTPRSVSEDRSRLRRSARRASEKQALIGIYSNLKASMGSRRAAHRASDQNGYGHSANRDVSRPAEHPFESACDDQRQHDSDDSAGDAQGDRLGKKLHQHIARSGADGHAKTDFTRPFGNRQQHDV